ncbi:MAG: hypothetical protein ABI551_11725, partial [Polyangiaceae bacterium]
GTTDLDPNALGPLGLVVVDGQLTMNSTAIVGTRAGAEIEGASAVEIHRSLVADTRESSLGYYVENNYVGVGILVESAAQLLIDGSTIRNTRTAGMIALGQTTLNDVLVTGTRAGGDGVGGRALSAQGSSAVAVGASAFMENGETGVLAAEHAALTISDSTIDQTTLDRSGSYGIGIFVGEDDVPASISSTTLRQSAGPAIAVSNAGLSVKASAIVDNAVGIAVLGQSSLVEGDGNGDPMTVAVSKDTVFAGNQTRVGSGNIPLPSVLTVPRTGK